MKAKDIERFWEKVSRETGNDCWNWQACNGRGEYGQFRLGGETVSAHRLSWKIENGEIPEGMCILHKCDNPSCVRPDHLFLGTNSDNVRDRDEKGRQAKGEKNGMFGRTGEKSPGAKLDANTVFIIRRVYEREEGVTQRELSDLYGVSQKQISNIVNSKQWSHIK